jgi:hypothetical protein
MADLAPQSRPDGSAVRVAKRGDGRVVCIGRSVMLTATGEIPGQYFECLLTFRDGLVIQLESQPRSDA